MWHRVAKTSPFLEEKGAPRGNPLACLMKNNQGDGHTLHPCGHPQTKVPEDALPLGAGRKGEDTIVARVEASSTRRV